MTKAMENIHHVANNVYELSSNFALRIVKLYQYLTEQKQEKIISKQLLRSGTSIGANAFEGKNAYNRDDFTFKMNIALKEAGETGYWIDLLHQAKYLDDIEYDSLYKDWTLLYSVLMKIVKTTKSQNSNLKTQKDKS